MIDFKNLKGDIFGGVNAAIIALPAALGFGTLAGLQPIYGLYGAIFLGLVASLIGGTKTLISNPTGPMAVVTLGIVMNLYNRFFVSVGDNYYSIKELAEKGIAKADVSKHLDVLTAIDMTDRLAVIWPYLFYVIILAGLVQILFGVFKLGKYIQYIPTPVVSGFMSGIGLIIIISQIPKFLGSNLAGGDALDVISNLTGHIQSLDPISVTIALGTMAIIYLFPRITKVVPGQLIAIVSMTLLAFTLKIDPSYQIPAIPQTLPNPLPQLANIFNFQNLFFGENSAGMLSLVILSGITIAIIGIIDALLTAVVADQLTKQKHNPDLEMMGQGLGNIVSGFFGGMMGAGTTPATVLNIKSGGRTQLSGIIHALLLALVLLAAAPIASMIPKAALAGLLITVGISILDFEVMKQLKKIPIQDTIVMFVVLLLTAFWDLMYAVSAGLIMAAMIFMKKMADVVEGESSNTKFDRLVDQLVDTFENNDEFREKVEIRNLSGPIFFGFASRFQDQMDEIEADKKAILLNFGGVNYMDQSGMYTLRESVQRLVDKGKLVAFSELSDTEHDLLEGINVIPDLVPEKVVFSSVEEAVMWLNEPGHLDNQYTADDELYIPSAYTPNGDGINDEWQLRNIDRYPSCVVTITTREGQEVFRSIGYVEMWEGIYNGKRLPSEQYLYKIDLYGDGRDVREGRVSIFR